MNTLIYTSVLGLFCMVMEILKLRRFLLPLLVIGLSLIFGAGLQDWNHPQSFYNNMLVVNNFSVAFGALAIFICLLIFILSGEFYSESDTHVSDYLAIILFILCGALMMLGFANLTMLFLGIETLSISLYVLAGSNRFDIRSNEAGFKYFLMGSFASGFLLFGIALIYGVTHSFHVEKIAEYTINNQGNISPLFYAGMALVVFAMLFKASAAPFHFWAPDVYEGSPALITALMSTLVKIAAFAAFYRLMASCFLFTFEKAELILGVAAIATLIIGNLIALSQDNFKRLLAYSGISHAGYMLLAILSVRTNTESALFYYSVAYALSTIAVFAVALIVFKITGSEDISAFNGLGKKNPLLAAALTMGMLSLAGIPPFAGFFGKYYIFTEALKNGHSPVGPGSHFFWLTMAGILASIIGVFYYFKVVIAMYGKPGNDIEIKGNFANNLVLWTCLALALLFGLFPSMIVTLL